MMIKLIRVGVLVLVTSIVWPRGASADVPNLRQTIRSAEHFMSVDFPLSAAVECDEQRQRHGATGSWDTDSRCNVDLERLAALISLITGGAFWPADAVTAWCSAAEIVNGAKEALESFRRGPDESREARNQRAWDGMPPYQQALFWALNLTIATWVPPDPEFED